MNNTHNNNNNNTSSIRIKSEPIEECIMASHKDTYQRVHSLSLSPEPHYKETVTLSKSPNKNELSIDLKEQKHKQFCSMQIKRSKKIKKIYKKLARPFQYSQNG